MTHFAPAELARMLRLPPPTRQQERIIAAPLDPLLVVAGAGSGKTETMAARVVYLVANEIVRPEQVLGLTFTRKAAGELTQRIRARLSQLARALGGADDLLAGEPTIATYHAYAGRVLAEHGLRAGYEPGTRLLSEASCWQLADALVRRYEGDMSEVDSAPASVTGYVIDLAAQLAEHLVEPADVQRLTGQLLDRISTLAPEPTAKVAEIARRQRVRAQILPLVSRYARRKGELEVMDFGDQLARAARVARDHPEVARTERDRYRVVLLDEYQDTSYAQLVLLRSLYGDGHPVTAVGDPCQSIYGWRGASVGTLDRFPTDFTTRGGAAQASVKPLSISFRNRPGILTVANRLAEPLRAGGHPVAVLAPAADGDEVPAVRAALLTDQRAEAAWIAGRLSRLWASGDRPPTAAVLVRTRAQLPVLETALRAAGLPVEVVGLGGLLDTPEVRDVVSTLRVLADPAEGGALLRLLTGPRWRLGPRDIVALYRRARALAAARRGDDETDSDRLADAVLAEALDDLGPQQGYSPEGHRRLARYAAELRALRTRLDQPLPDLVADVVRTIGLDVEVAVTRGGLAAAHLDRFGDEAARFAADADAPTLSAFLAYLTAAEEQERGLEPGTVDVVEGAVQLLTVHAAKGLEWDVVAVAGLNRSQFPARCRQADAWLTGLGVLPFPLRGDKEGLPSFDLTGAGTGKDVTDAVDAFEAAWAAHSETEERRLAYVAVTRPRHLLLCSGFWWGTTQTKRLGPSAFLTEVHDSGVTVVDEWVDPPADDATNPLLAEPERASWPVSPLSPARRAAYVEAAALVRAAGGSIPAGRSPEPTDGEGARWAVEVDLLLAERDRARMDSGTVALPGRLTVSQLVTLRRDPAALARTLRRPLPEPPDPAGRRGTAFHRWLEQRYGAQRLLDVDELPGAADANAAPDAEFAALRAAFEASEWADRVPVAVEVPFSTVVGGVLVRGRMDAVFAEPTGGYVVVDWKTGRRPSGAAARAAAVQLAAYRLAWAELAGVDVGDVAAAFHYVAGGVTVRPVDLLTGDELAALVTRVPDDPDPAA